jgi:hypothetical protein
LARVNTFFVFLTGTDFQLKNVLYFIQIPLKGRIVANLLDIKKGVAMQIRLRGAM